MSRAGIRIVESQHLTLVTDLPPSPAIAELPRVTAAALPTFAKRFGVPLEELENWRLRAYLIGNREKFDALGLIPEQAGPFPHGWSLGHEAWLVDQPSDYYRRHLFLHEATHSFMMTELGGCGPPWFMEGMAELLGTHKWDAPTGELTLGILPASRKASPYWGRVKRVRAARTPQAIAAIMKLDNSQPLPTESYAWAWALAKFLDGHPRYRDRFRKLPKLVLQDDFNVRFRKTYATDARQLAAEWRLFAATLEYGHDLEREAIDFKPTKPLANQPTTVVVRTDRGWQSTRLRVKKGDRLRFAPSGRFTIAREPDSTPWPCEANGITLRYHGGRPLGMLLAAVGPRGLTDPIAIAGGGIILIPNDGIVFLRVNDSPAELAQNEGELSVAITPE